MSQNKTTIFFYIIVANVVFAAYSVLFYLSAPIIDLPKLMFSTGDSLSYLAATNWLFDVKEANGLYGGIHTRPFLYPLLIGLVRSIFNDKYYFPLYVIQFVMLWGTVNIVFISVYEITKIKILSIAGFFLLLCHFSLMGLTRHALTEIAGLFCLSIFILSITKFEKRNGYYIGIFALALATVIRPIYQTMLFIWCGYVVFRDIKAIMQPAWMFKFILCLAPIFIQFYLVYLETGQIFISDISSFTFRRWFMSQLYFKVEWQTVWTLEQATSMVEKMSYTDMGYYIIAHLRDAQYVYRTNIFQEGLLYGAEYGPGAWVGLSVWIHKTFTFAHLLFLPIMLFYILHCIYNRFIPPITIIYVFFVIQVLSTGISAWQGDRLVVTSAPLWIIVYLWVISGLFRKGNLL